MDVYSTWWYMLIYSSRTTPLPLVPSSLSLSLSLSLSHARTPTRAWFDSLVDVSSVSLDKVLSSVGSKKLY